MSRQIPMPFLSGYWKQEATRNKCVASSNKCLTSSNKKLLETIYSQFWPVFLTGREATATTGGASDV